MPRASRPWFRFYVEAFADRKLRKLRPSERWLWVAILGIARQSPIPGALLISMREAYDIEDIADFAAMPERDVRLGIERMVASGMLEMDGDIGCWYVPQWNDRQFESDDVTARTQRFREQRRNVPNPAAGTPPDTEADTDCKTPLPPQSGGARDHQGQHANCRGCGTNRRAQQAVDEKEQIRLKAQQDVEATLERYGTMDEAAPDNVTPIRNVEAS